MGARVSLASAVFSVIIGMAAATIFGLLVGHYEGAWDRIIMCSCDVLFVFLDILLAIAVVAIDYRQRHVECDCRSGHFQHSAFARLLRGNTLVLQH